VLGESPLMAPRPRETIAPRLGVLAAAALFSTGGAAIKACSLTGWQVASFRSGIAALILLLAIPAARKGWDRATAAVAVSYAATLVLFVLANKLTTAASTIYLQSTAPLYVLIASPALLGERVRRADLAFMAALALGLALLLAGADDPVATAPNPLLGNVLATLSGVAYGLTILGLRWRGRGREGGDDAGLAPVVLGNLLAFAVCLPWALPLRDSRPLDWLGLAYLGVVQIGVSYVLLTRSLRRVQALEASLLLLLEPVLNPLWAWLVKGERPGTWTLAGGAVILLATLIHAGWAAATDRPARAAPDSVSGGGVSAHP
jgi:DME family drug/metabolite transporter